MDRKLRAMLWAFLICIFSLPALAEDCLRMHVIQNSKMGYIDENGNPAGAHWEFLSAIEERSGICMDKILLPIPRLWAAIELGDVDGGVVFRSPERENLYWPIAPTMNIFNVVIPRAGLSIRDYDDLKGLNIGVTRGTQLNDQFDSDSSLSKVELSSYEQMIKMVAAKHLDAIAGSGVSLTSELSKQGFDDRVNFMGAINLGSREQWLLMSRKSNNLNKGAALRQATEALKKEGVFDLIMDKYYGSNWRIVNGLQQSKPTSAFTLNEDQPS